MKKFKKEPAPDKENLNEDITEAEEEIAACDRQMEALENEIRCS